MLARNKLVLLTITILLPELFGISAYGQEKQKGSVGDEGWTLQQCIDHAQKNNLQVRQSELDVKTAKIDKKQSKMDLLPDLSGFVNHSYDWGQRVDQFTNEFVTKRVRSNSFSLSSNVTLFNGFRNYNTIEKRKHDLAARKYDVEKLKNDIAVNVATGFLQVLFDKEAVNNAKEQVRISEMQVERIEKLVEAGKVARGDLLDMRSQLENDRSNLVQKENNLDMSYLSLIHQLQLEGEEAENFEIDAPDLSGDPDTDLPDKPEMIYNDAVETRPELQSYDEQIKSAKKSVDIARGAKYPVLSMQGAYGTGFSQNRKERHGDPTIEGIDTTTLFTTSGERVLQPRIRQETRTVPFMEQVDDNLNQSLSFQLSIPIFSRFSTKHNIERSEIALDRIKLQKESAKNQLRQDIQQAYADAMAALRQYKASKKRVASLEESFKYAKVRYEQRMINTVSFTDSKNQLANARSNLLQAKYDLIFKAKVLDFYRGNSLAFGE